MMASHQETCSPFPDTLDQSLVLADLTPRPSTLEMIDMQLRQRRDVSSSQDKPASPTELTEQPLPKANLIKERTLTENSQSANRCKDSLLEDGTCDNSDGGGDGELRATVRSPLREGRGRHGKSRALFNSQPMASNCLDKATQMYPTGRAPGVQDNPVSSITHKKLSQQFNGPTQPTDAKRIRSIKRGDDIRRLRSGEIISKARINRQGKIEVRFKSWSEPFYVWPFGEEQMQELYGQLRHTRRPWMDEYDTGMKGYPFGEPPANGAKDVYLFDPSVIYNVLPEECREALYYVDLFFRNRFYTSKAQVLTPRSPDRLLQSWRQFIRDFCKDPDDFVEKVDIEEERYLTRTSTGISMKIHRLSIKEHNCCTVPAEYRCPSCYADSTRAAFEDIEPHLRSHSLGHKHWELNQRMNVSIAKRNANGVLSSSESAELGRVEKMLANLREAQTQFYADREQHGRDIAYTFEIATM